MIIQNIINRRTEEASFLWLQCDSAEKKPHYSMSDLAKLNNRVKVEIDGLRISAEEDWQICKDELSWKKPDEVFTAAVLESCSQAMKKNECQKYLLNFS